jgi:hypothetical protein
MGSGKMRLYILRQRANTFYDTYDAVIVVAKDAADAVTIHPNKTLTWDDEGRDQSGTWVRQDQVYVECIGEAHPSLERGVLLASFNAG